MAGNPKSVHQDYIVKQRYQNTLPPPPGAPKLLKIPHDPWATYLSPFYLDRVRAAEPINIEADAFLGMPIDLVGMPGVFEGDDRAILAPLNPPPVHPRDKLLLRPLKSLGKGGSEPSDISFLRRTQYVASEDRSGRGSTSAPSLNAPVKRRRVDVSKEDPSYILRSTMKGFDIANPATAPSEENGIRAIQPTKEELDAWKIPRHPANPALKLVDSYPLLPDLDAITNAPDGGFSVITFRGQPTNVKDKHDERFDTAFLRSLPDELVIQDYQTRLQAHYSNPHANPKPQLPMINFELFLAQEVETSRALKRKRDIYEEERDSMDLYTHRSQDNDADVSNDVIKLTFVRGYESGLQTENDDAYQEIGLALHDVKASGDGSQGHLVKAAYFYPVSGKTQLKPRRTIGPMDVNEDQANEMDLRFRDAEPEECERREDIKRRLEEG